MRVIQRRNLRAFLSEKIDFLVVEPTVLLGLAVQEGARIGGGERDLNRVGIDLLGEIERLLDRLPGLPGQTQNERAMDDDAELVTVLGEAAGRAADAGRCPS